MLILQGGRLLGQVEELGVGLILNGSGRGDPTLVLPCFPFRQLNNYAKPIADAVFAILPRPEGGRRQSLHCLSGTYCAGLLRRGWGSIPHTSKLQTVRSRLYRRRCCQPNTHFVAFFKIYKIYTPPLGRKKRQSLFSPKKNLLARAN